MSVKRRAGVGVYFIFFLNHAVLGLGLALG